MKQCINLADSTFNLYVLYIKLAKNTKQFRRLVLANVITVIHFLFGREGILWALALRFWAAEHLHPPLCQKATSIQCVKYSNTYMLAHVGGMIFLKKCFLISIYINVKLIVLPKNSHL